MNHDAEQLPLDAMTESKEEVVYPDVLQYMEIKPYKKHSATVIFLHGLGDSGNGMHRIVDPSLKWKSSEGLGHIKFIFPSAPRMSVTGNKGNVVPSWFDYYSFDIPNRAEDEEGLYRAVNWINKIISIEETEHNIPSNRIIIGGLSQGGAVSLLTTITIKKPLAGLFALSTYIPLRRKTPEIPIFWGHGKKDRQVNHEFSIKCAETLAANLEVRFQPYEDVTLTREELEKNSPEGLRFHSYGNLGHWVNDRELVDLFVWILFLLPDINLKEEPGFLKKICGRFSFSANFGGLINNLVCIPRRATANDGDESHKRNRETGS